MNSLPTVTLVSVSLLCLCCKGFIGVVNCAFENFTNRVLDVNKLELNSLNVNKVQMVKNVSCVLFNINVVHAIGHQVLMEKNKQNPHTSSPLGYWLMKSGSPLGYWLMKSGSPLGYWLMKSGSPSHIWYLKHPGLPLRLRPTTVTINDHTT